MSVPAATIRPEVGDSMAPMRFSSVVLPDPDGPSTTTNSPNPTSRFTSRTACTADGPDPYTFTTSMQLTAVAVTTVGVAVEGPLTFSSFVRASGPVRAQRPPNAGRTTHPEAAADRSASRRYPAQGLSVGR